MESIESGSSTPCLSASFTSSLDKPFPEISFNCKTMQSANAFLVKFFFSGKEKTEKLLGESSCSQLKQPLYRDVMTPEDT